MTVQILDQLEQLPPGAKGRAFESLVAWYLENAPQFRHRVRRVFAWKNWPGRWGRDAGIDLVAELHSGDLWAVQAKGYAKDYAIKKSDVDSFLSESARPQF